MVGKVIQDIELLEHIGKGGFGSVYKGRHVESGELFAVKLASSTIVAVPDLQVAWEREVKVLSQLQHPHLLQLESHGVDEEVGPYLQMALQRLRQRLGGEACRLAVPVSAKGHAETGTANPGLLSQKRVRIDSGPVE